LKRRGPSRIHAGLTRERALVGTPYLGDPGLRAEYDAEIAPRTRAALARILAPLSPRLSAVRRVLDLGAGTGAAGETVRAQVEADAGGSAVELVSVDRVAARPGVIVADLRREVRPRGVEGHFDLIVAAHLLNELGRTMSVVERAALVFAWARELLAEGGLIVLIEPALRETARDLLTVRDRLVTANFSVLAPCFWQGPCPALARDRDWCHDSADWAADAPGGKAGRSRVDFSYLVLARGEERLTDKRLFRVVSDPMVEKGRLRLFGCGPAGRHALVRLDRERTADNADFDRAHRGDIIVVGKTEPAGDGLRVTGATRVDRR
jgi:Mitochondrial small ribosomal subunit Rsm22